MKRRNKPHKKIVLPDEWIKNTKEVKEYKSKCESTCSVTKTCSDRLVLDHTHIDGIGTDGKVRGLLCSEVNMLEGRFLSLFKRSSIEGKYGMDFPNFLINLGEYLLKDNSSEPYHYQYMDEMRKRINRLTVSEIRSKLQDDYQEEDITGTKKELVQRYIQLWVDNIKEG